ncbi:MAG: 1-deoxy-D-xylulose-5-phosphate synthase [Actinomycetaceae bacterium]|nr:1-deoxy-D-xylulose-5-phosphate synthase [Actinomycetaceae bacterium]
MSKLEQICGPGELKRMSSAELVELASEIRNYLVESVSKTGGHLGPNLGVVELTIALHRQFNSPRDIIIFDTGHQSYVHKLLTGRKDFSMLRQKGGLSGYPSRAESEHDVVENSHASTAISWAEGISRIRSAEGDSGYVIAVIGDGALTGGMAWEALDTIATIAGKRLIIVVNDNGRSYAPTIGGLAHHLDAVRTNPAYERALNWGKKQLKSRGLPGEIAYDALHGLKAGVKDVLVPQPMFETLGIKYTGPVDGHDITALEFAFARAKEYGEPIIIHAITQKGRGYTPAENDNADRFHAVGKIHPETGLPIKPARFGWTSVFAEEILEIARTDARIIGVTAAMLQPVGFLPLQTEFPDRVIDVGIAEQNAVGMAAGMAYAGAHPVVAVYATFLNRAFDQVLMDVALHHAPVTICLDRAGITGDDGASHNGMWDMALCSLVPGLKIAAPRDEQSFRRLLREATSWQGGPTLVRYPKGSIGAQIQALRTLSANTDTFGDHVRAPEVVYESGEGPSITLVAVGAFVPLAIETAKLLPGCVTVVDPGWVVPLADSVVELAGNADLVITLEDGLIAGGVGSSLRDRLSEDGHFVPVKSFGIPKRFLKHASRTEILQELGLTAPSIAEETLKVLKQLQAAQKIGE